MFPTFSYVRQVKVDHNDQPFLRLLLTLRMKGNIDMFICQIVGYKDSGKTTLMKKMISYASKCNMHIGSLKHHGHGGEPDIAQETDSHKHLQAGSMMSGVQGEHIFQLHLADTSQYTLSDLVKLYAHFPIDILFIEGYKYASYPKIVLIKEREDLLLLHELTNIIAVGSWIPIRMLPEYPLTFPINQSEQYLSQLLEYITVSN